jgi:hypothetical protein
MNTIYYPCFFLHQSWYNYSITTCTQHKPTTTLRSYRVLHDQDHLWHRRHTIGYEQVTQIMATSRSLRSYRVLHDRDHLWHRRQTIGYKQVTFPLWLHVRDHPLWLHVRDQQIQNSNSTLCGSSPAHPESQPPIIVHPLNSP